MIPVKKITFCRGCGKQIALIKTVNGKTMPVDMRKIRFVQDDEGTGRYVMEDGSVMRGSDPENEDQETMTGYISHFATCPMADQFRRRR